jgi:murein DD-endopeptidase MepM/ murein hydrolase activator NlpD
MKDRLKHTGKRLLKWIVKHLTMFIVANIVWVSLVLVLFVVFVSILGAMDIANKEVPDEPETKIETIYKSSPLQPPYTITQEFGPYTGSAAGFGFHYGVDMVAYYGANVHSVLEGTVISINDTCGVVSWNCGGGYGNQVYVEYVIENQKIYVMYGHLATVHVISGQKVVQGQVIGLQGNSGKSTGTHLHFEVRTENSGNRSVRVNPRNYFEF